MRLGIAYLAAMMCSAMCVPAKADVCDSLLKTAQTAAHTADRLDAQANADRRALLRGNTLRNPDSRDACTNLGRLYRTTQDALNASNKARLNLDRAVGVCPPELTAKLNAVIRSCQQQSDALRSELRDLSPLGSSIRCNLY